MGNPYVDLFRQVHAWWEILQQGQHVVSLAGELGNETEGDIARNDFGVLLFARSSFEEFKHHVRELLAACLHSIENAEQRNQLDAASLFGI